MDRSTGSSWQIANIKQYKNDTNQEDKAVEWTDLAVGCEARALVNTIKCI